MGLGIGAIIGTGVFVLIGTATIWHGYTAWRRAGNYAVILASGIVCALAALWLCGIFVHDAGGGECLFLYLCVVG